MLCVTDYTDYLIVAGLVAANSTETQNQNWIGKPSEANPCVVKVKRGFLITLVEWWSTSPFNEGQ